MNRLYDRDVAQVLWDTLEYVDELVRWHEAGKDLDRANGTRDELRAKVGAMFRTLSDEAPPQLTDEEMLALVERDVNLGREDTTGHRRQAYSKINFYLMRRGK